MEAGGVLNGLDYLGNYTQLVGDCQVEVVVQRYRDVALAGSAGLAVLARRVKSTDVQKLDYRPPYPDDQPVRLALSADLWLTEWKSHLHKPHGGFLLLPNKAKDDILFSNETKKGITQVGLW